MNAKIVAYGAEALILKENNRIIKKRIEKSYRLPELDKKLRKQRTKREARLLEKAFLVIPVPEIIKQSEYELELELIEGKKLSDYLDALPRPSSVCKLIGEDIAKLHDLNIIHGDLTTSNMILDKKNKLFIIDFGLGFESARVEDKAVDLHVLREALEAKHFAIAEKCWKKILKGYKISKNCKETLIRLKTVEQRGRYKTQY